MSYDSFRDADTTAAAVILGEPPETVESLRAERDSRSPRSRLARRPAGAGVSGVP